MAWATKSLQALVTEQVRAFNAALPGADAALARNNLHPTAKVLAGGLFHLHSFAAWAADQRFVLTCDADQLDRHGAEMKPPVPRRPAASATGMVTATSVAGGAVASGTVLTRSDGRQFLATAGVIIAAGVPAQVPVADMTPGAAGATDASAVMTASSGVTGTVAFAVSAGGLGGAADAEDDEAYRQRLLFAKAYPDHAGAPPDWLRYAMEVPGVTRAFVDPLAAGRGSVVVYPLFDGTRPFGIGLESDRAIVQLALNERAGAQLVVVRNPVALAVPITVANLQPGTPETRSAVAAEIAATFARQSRVAGLSDPHPSMGFLATPASFSRSWIWQSVSNAAGEESHAIAAPPGDIALTEGQMAVPGDITFT
jgi:uncharacterized phage protein gp47/JayE